MATIAPLYEDENILTAPVGRLMVADTATIPTQNTNNNGVPVPPVDPVTTLIALAPAVLSVNSNVISAEFSADVPGQLSQPNTNPKFDFGAVSLVVTNGTDSATVAR